ncbi:alpha/beta fold hydrolase [Actinoplanes sp. TRM 88003]|uniref:Alpha/beta fold hydrolase n=1 Tax=Paractinoplanes aksuensis TaxID=2939490 RepID=A0ABT1DI41_9ACTN|nr:alpha/beta fold hydrolase [Actinoplanes aksuensis]MCO8270492.1 alpha/beta fold hydrolase [Actinoplanes aksuensis]
MTFATSGRLRLWTERIGPPSRPAVLLIAGASAQGFTMPDALVARLVERGAQVIRYDHRDTGRSSTVDFDRDPYGLTELGHDAVAVLDAYGLDSAHIVGGSMGGMIAQWLGLHEPARVRSLTLLSTSPVGIDPADSPLPPPAPHFLQYEAGPPGVESDVALFRLMNGDARPFDEPATRAMLERCWARAADPAAARNHGRLVERMSPDLQVPLSTITAPTVVVHGDVDPIYAPAHGEALAAAIPGARFELVPGMGHVYLSPGLPELLADLVPLRAR